MSYSKDPKSQMVRATEYLTRSLERARQTSRNGSISYDVARDRVLVQVDKIEVAALGPKEWFMSDDELRQLFDAAVINNFGEGPEPFREPGV
jgi:hypothetical protein